MEEITQEKDQEQFFKLLNGNVKKEKASGVLVENGQKGESYKFAGYGSTFGNWDSHGDCMMKGCYKPFLTSDLVKDKMKFLVGHKEAMGTFDVVRETNEGLYFEASVSKNAKSEIFYDQVKSGAYNKTSVRFNIFAFKTVEDKNLRKSLAEKYPWLGYEWYILKEITKAKPLEISAVELPANEETSLYAVKSENGYTGIEDIEFFMNVKNSLGMEIEKSSNNEIFEMIKKIGIDKIHEAIVEIESRNQKKEQKQDNAIDIEKAISQFNSIFKG